MTKVRRQKKATKGFTIIEVALVLAVAALIFLVVFLAVPALQRNQRDDARKRDVADTVQAVVNAIANKNAIPGTGNVYNGTAVATTDLGAYLDPVSGNVDFINVVAGSGTGLVVTYPYTFTATAATTAAGTATSTNPSINAIIVYTGATCDGHTKLKAGATRSAAVVVQVENGGAGKYYCQTAN
ncbi:hypothetical protein FWC31_03915 [Candidatus Saccharibacteria bacterium]|nr:hypothetical protein [Candidatus Saccharibacteria bacterium]